MNLATRLFCALLLIAAASVVVPSPATAQGAAPVLATPDRVSPPIPIGNIHPVLVAEYADTIYAVNITVDVNPSGKADLNTLTLSGSAAEFNRKAITDWLRTTAFRPAKRNGVPIRGTFRMTAETLKQADRDGL